MTQRNQRSRSFPALHPVNVPMAQRGTPEQRKKAEAADRAQTHRHLQAVSNKEAARRAAQRKLVDRKFGGHS